MLCSALCVCVHVVLLDDCTIKRLIEIVHSFRGWYAETVNCLTESIEIRSFDCDERNDSVYILSISRMACKLFIAYALVNIYEYFGKRISTGT